MKRLLAIGLLVILLSGCSDPEVAYFPRGVIKFNDDAKDIQVSVDPYKETTSVSPSGDMDTAELFEHFYILQRLGERTHRSFWARDSQTHLLNFYDEPSTHSEVIFSESPYAEVLTASSQAEYMEATQDLDRLFENEKEKLRFVLSEMQEQQAAEIKAMSLSEAMQAIVDFMNMFEMRLLKSNVDESFKMALLSGIYDEFWYKLPATRSIISQLEASADFEAAVATLKGLISTMDIQLTQDEAGQIESASQIGPMLNQERLKPKHAFVILVRLWDLMDEEERTEQFGEVSPELYDYLNDKSRKQIQCLKNRDCKGLVTKIAEKWFILPELKKYGVDKLRQEIESSAVSGLKELTAEMATDLIKDLPSYLGDAISLKMDQEKIALLEIRAQYPTYIKNEVQKWYEDSFEKSSLPALEQRRINLNSASHFKPKATNSEMITSADTLGTALLASAQMFRKSRSPIAQEQPQKMQLLGLTRLGQLLAHSGFERANGKAFQSLSRAFESGEPFNIEAGFEFPSLFAMQSHVRVKKGFDMITSFAPADWNVISQSRLLMGFSHKMDNFKDWENGPMDDALGKFKAKDLLPGIPSDELETAAFPEEAFLALSFGNAASILNNMKTTGTPLFIMCQGNEIIWADSELECLKASALAGIVNIRNKNRQKDVKLMDQAKFLEAVIAFLKRSEVMAKRTKSKYLTEVRGGTSAIQDYNAAYPELRNLAIALTNFVISKFQNSRGEFGKSYSLVAKTKKPLFGKASFDEHLQGTRALVAAAEYFRIGPYQRAAVRSYYGLNNEFFNTTTQFYKTGDVQISSMDLARTLETLERLESWIQKKDSRNQLNSLLEAWRNSLRPKSI